MEPMYPFVSAAEWPDDIKGMNWKSFNPLHFVNLKIIENGFVPTTETSWTNATYAIAHCRKTLTAKADPVNLIPRSICMRLMIHIIGDIHQPLHTSALFSTEFPKGDLGGNLFEIIYLKKKTHKELHEFWDSIVDQYSSVQVPLTDTSFAKLTEYAT
jgi:hypothetical protein